MVNMDIGSVHLPRHTMFDLIGMCEREAHNLGYEPAYVRVIREAVEAELRLMDAEAELLSKPFADAEDRRKFLEDSATETPLRQRKESCERCGKSMQSHYGYCGMDM